MKRKKKQKKKSGLSVSLPPEDKAFLDSLLLDCKNQPPEHILTKIRGPAIVLALVEHLPTNEPSSISLLQALYDAYTGKDIRKAVKRALFRLKGHGFEVPELSPKRSESVISFATSPMEEPQAFVGPVDGFGFRGVFVLLPRAVSGYDIGIGMVNDETGIVEFHATTYSKKKMKELKSAIHAEMGVDVSTSLSHAVTVLEHAYENSLAGSLDIPEDYLEFRPLMLPHGKRLDRSPVYELLPDAPDSLETLTSSQLEKLFAHPSLEEWIIDPVEMEPLLTELERMEDGPLVLSEAQQEERIQGIKETWAEEHFSEPKLKTLKYRLEEMAYVFVKRDETDYALLALSAASRGLEKSIFQGISPVVSLLLEKSLTYYEELDEDEETKQMVTDNSPSIVFP